MFFERFQISPARLGKLSAAVLLILVHLSGPGWCRNLARELSGPVETSIAIRQETQKQKEKWQDQKEKLLARLNALEAENKRLLELKKKLEKDQASLEKNVAGLLAQEKEAARVAEKMPPFLEDVYAKLLRNLENSLPFLREERALGLKQLRALLDDPSAPAGEGFQKAMDLLLKEAEYGNTVETYPDRIRVDGREMMADVLRLGRMSLFYAAPDRESAGYLDLADRRWKPLGRKEAAALARAMDMVEKKKPHDLVLLPLGELRLP